MKKTRMSLKGISKSPYNLGHALASPGKVFVTVGKELKGVGGFLRKKKKL